MVGVNANTGDTVGVNANSFFVSFFLDVNLAVEIGPTDDFSFFSFFLCNGVIGLDARDAVAAVKTWETAGFFFFLLYDAAIDRSTTAC